MVTYLIDTIAAIAIAKFFIEPIILYARDSYLYPYLGSVFHFIDTKIKEGSSLSFEKLVLLAFQDAGHTIQDRDVKIALSLVKRFFDVEKLLNDHR